MKVAGATHVAFEPEHADEEAKRIVRMAITAFTARKGKPVPIPDERASGLAGFCVEAILAVLEKVDPADPLKPVIDNIVNGHIFGAVGFAGCPSPKMRDTAMAETMAKELLKKNVLIVATGCRAHIFAQSGMLSAVEALRRTDPACDITVVAGERVPTYTPCFLSRLVSGEIAEDKLALKSEDLYERHRVTLLSGVAAAGVRPAESSVTLADGKTLAHDRLLLACGGS